MDRIKKSVSLITMLAYLGLSNSEDPFTRLLLLFLLIFAAFVSARGFGAAPFFYIVFALLTCSRDLKASAYLVILSHCVLYLLKKKIKNKIINSVCLC
jgi:hypothetical protein